MKQLIGSLVLLFAFTATAAAERATIVRLKDGTLIGVVYTATGPITLSSVTIIDLSDPTPTPPPPVTAGKRDIVIIRESAQVDAKMASAQTLLQSDPQIAQWKKERGHRVIYLDPDDKDETGTKPSPVLVRYRALLPAGQQLPAIVITDRDSGAAVFVGSYNLSWKASDVVDLVKKHGG